MLDASLAEVLSTLKSFTMLRLFNVESFTMYRIKYYIYVKSLFLLIFE